MLSRNGQAAFPARKKNKKERHRAAKPERYLRRRGYPAPLTRRLELSRPTRRSSVLPELPLRGMLRKWNGMMRPGIFHLDSGWRWG